MNPPSGLSQADRDAMKAMSDEDQREQRELRAKTLESQMQSEQAKANANEMSKLLEEARRRERESETKRTYLETKFQNYIQGTGQSESDTRSNFESEMNKLKDELETMRAIANANLQPQNIPYPPASFATSLQGASASRQSSSILRSTNRSPTKSQSFSNLSSGSNSAELLSNPALLVDTIRSLLRTELSASSKSSTSERMLSPGELSAVEKEKIVQDMQPRYIPPNRNVTFQDQAGNDRTRSNSVVDSSKFRPTRSASNLATFQFSEQQLDDYARGIRPNVEQESDASDLVCFPDLK